MQWDYAIDAGSETMRLCSRSELRLYHESSLTAQRVGRETPFAWGDRALQILGREPQEVFIRRAVRGGLPSDMPLLARWVRRLTDEGDKRVLRRASVLMALAPTAAPEAVRELEFALQDEEVELFCFVSSDLACAVGAGRDPLDAEGTLIVDMGAQHITATLFAGGRTVRTETLAFGASRIEEGIMRAAREQLGCAIGPHTARAILNDLAAAEGTSGDVVCAHPAFDLVDSLPRLREFSAALVQPCVDEMVEAVIQMLSRLTRFAPVELAADLCRVGITLAGGGANLYGLERRISRALELPVSVADEPEDCVIRGLMQMLNKPELYKLMVFGGTAEKKRA